MCRTGVRTAQFLSTRTEPLLQLLKLLEPLSCNFCHHHRVNPDSCPAVITTAPERERLHWFCHPPLQSASWQHNSLFRQALCPGFGLSLSSLTSGPGERRLSYESLQVCCLCFPPCGMGSCIRMSPFCLCLNCTAHRDIQW